MLPKNNVSRLVFANLLARLVTQPNGEFYSAEVISSDRLPFENAVIKTHLDILTDEGLVERSNINLHGYRGVVYRANDHRMDEDTRREIVPYLFEEHAISLQGRGIL